MKSILFKLSLIHMMQFLVFNLNTKYGYENIFFFQFFLTNLGIVFLQIQKSLLLNKISPKMSIFDSTDLVCPSR